MLTKTRFLALAVVASAALSVFVVTIRFGPESQRAGERRPPLEASRTRTLGGAGDGSGNSDRAARSGRAAADRSGGVRAELPGRAPRSDADGRHDSGPEETEFSWLADFFGASLRRDASAPLPQAGSRRRYEDVVEERRQIREKKRNEKEREVARGKEPGKRSLEQFRAHWEAEAALQEKMGPDAYEQMLYENGEANVVSVKWVAPGSAAALAGLQPGDVVFSYGGKRVYQPGAMRSLNLEAEPGQLIEVEFYRDGELLTTVLERDRISDASRGNTNGLRVVGERIQP